VLAEITRPEVVAVEEILAVQAKTRTKAGLEEEAQAEMSAEMTAVTPAEMEAQTETNSRPALREPESLFLLAAHSQLSSHFWAMYWCW